jgi:hypothetical protein
VAAVNFAVAFAALVFVFVVVATAVFHRLVTRDRGQLGGAIRSEVVVEPQRHRP